MTGQRQPCAMRHGWRFERAIDTVARTGTAVGLPMKSIVVGRAILMAVAMIASATTLADPSGVDAARQETPTKEAKIVWSDPVGSRTEMMPLAASALLLDIGKVGQRFIAIGERGQIVMSEDGKRFTQVADVPTRSNLASLAVFGSDAWAVGHDGVILHSSDGGLHWEMQRQDPLKDGAGFDRDPRQGAPLLDVMFTDAMHGTAIGAYSLFLATADGGKTWTEQKITVPTNGSGDNRDIGDDADSAADAGGRGADKGALTFSSDELRIGAEPNPHLNAIARTGSGGLLIVSERGSAFRSRDNGATWQRLQMPYDGSMFGVIGYEGEHVLTFGLRGHVYESMNLGDSWTELPTNTLVNLMGGTALPDGGAALVGANGVILVRRRSGEPFVASVDGSAGVIANAFPESANTLLLVGENGVSEHKLP